MSVGSIKYLISNVGYIIEAVRARWPWPGAENSGDPGLLVLSASSLACWALRSLMCPRSIKPKQLQHCRHLCLVASLPFASLLMAPLAFLNHTHMLCSLPQLHPPDLQLSTYFNPNSDMCKDLTQLPNAFTSVPQWSRP